MSGSRDRSLKVIIHKRSPYYLLYFGKIGVFIQNEFNELYEWLYNNWLT